MAVGTAREFAELKARDAKLGWVRARWDEPEKQRTEWMTAVYGDPDADLPDGYIQINTSNGTFSVHDAEGSGHDAFFKCVDDGVLRLS